MPKDEHGKAMALLKRQYENKLSEVKNQQERQHNERGAGRKKKATKQVVLRVLALRAEGLSQESISKAVGAELSVTISRTTVGESCVVSMVMGWRSKALFLAFSLCRRRKLDLMKLRQE